MTITMQALVKAHRERTAKLEQIEQKAKEDAAPIKKELQLLEAGMQKVLQSHGARSMATEYGTAYRQGWTKTKVTDWEKALEWVRANKRWEMLVHQVNKTAVLDETGEGTCPVPGVEIEKGFKINVRRR